MKAKLILSLLLILNVTRVLYSQVTIGKIEKTEVIEVLKPPIYDSLNNFKYFDRSKTYDNYIGYDPNYPTSMELFYKQYIGLQFYLPPFSNPSNYVTCDIRPFLFSTSPNIFYCKKVGNVCEKEQKLLPNKESIESELDSIVTFVYKPFCYGTIPSKYGGGPCIVNSKEVSDKYYTVLDVYGENDIINLMSKFKMKLDDFEKKGFKTDYRCTNFGRVINISNVPVYVLKDNKTNDTVYSLSHGRFILVPYFIKQKQLYDGKTFLAFNKYEQETIDASTGKTIIIPSLSKWTCEVNLLNLDYSGKKTNHYKIYYILKNDNDQTVLIDKLEDSEWNLHFILEDIYLKREDEKKLKQEELEAKRKKEEQERIEKEKITKQKHLQYCISKFGQSKGKLIAQRKVTIGMSKEMCKTAWGKPFWTSKTTTEYGVYEDWYYGFGFSLHFENGILKRIEE